MQINSEVTDIIRNVRITEQSIESGKDKKRVLKEQLDELLQGVSEYEEVTESVAQLKVARQDLKLRLMSNANYNDLMEKLGSTKEELKDDEDILSSHLLAFFALTQDRQIELGEGGDAREVILKGKLGKDQKYQTNIFAEPK